MKVIACYVSVLAVATFGDALVAAAAAEAAAFKHGGDVARSHLPSRYNLLAPGNGWLVSLLHYTTIHNFKPRRDYNILH